MTTRFIAFDLGAESGRCVVAAVRGGEITLDEVHRFPTHTVRSRGGLHWDILAIAGEIRAGLAAARGAHGPAFDGIGIDTWGVDYVLADAHGRVLGYPYHYRDDRTDGIMPAAFAVVPRETLYAKTGMQFLQFNTVFQLFAERRMHPSLLDHASAMLMIPDYFNYLLSGVMKSEYTIASTTGLIDPAARTWSRDLIGAFGYPERLFPAIAEPGSLLGQLLPDVAAEAGLDAGIPVIATACHDTASAVASVPAAGHDWAFLSSGTWSLMGVELDRPVLTGDSLRYNFTNEGGVNGTIRFLKNIAGLWPVQECRRTWKEEGREYTYAGLTRLASEAGCAGAWVDLNDPRFLKAGGMPEKILAAVREKGTAVREDPGWIIRVALESLAYSYRRTVRELAEVTGVRIARIHAVGGGVQNTLLAQLAADATGMEVVAGPVEGTVVGNVGVQAIARGIVPGVSAWREAVARSFRPSVYRPQNTGYFDAHEKEYEAVLA